MKFYVFDQFINVLKFLFQSNFFSIWFLFQHNVKITCMFNWQSHLFLWALLSPLSGAPLLLLVCFILFGLLILGDKVEIFRLELVSFTTMETKNTLMSILSLFSSLSVLFVHWIINVLLKYVHLLRFLRFPAPFKTHSLLDCFVLNTRYTINHL